MTDAAPSHATRPKRKRRALIIWSIVVVLLVAIAAVIGAYALRINNAVNKAETIPSAFPEASERPEATEGAVNILLLGTDTRQEGEDLLTDLGSRSDTMMFVHIPPDRESVQVMSLMRDSWVDIPGHGKAKLNAALAYGGTALLVQTIEGMLDQRIDHVAIVDFAGFKGLTDALGGVTVQNDLEFTSKNVGGYHFDQGQITLDGDQALAYVRERYAFADGDYQRVHNQQAYLRGLLNALLTRDTLTNPNKIVDIAESMSGYVAWTKDTMTSSVMIDLASSLAGISSSNVVTFTMPTLGTGMEGNQSVVYVNEEGVQQVADAFAQESMTGFVPPNER